MVDSPQQAVVTLLGKLIDSSPQIIAAIAAAWVVIWRTNKKTDEKATETNAIVEKKTDETKEKLGEVHVAVNGNYTALQAELAAERTSHAQTARENDDLRAMVKKHKTPKRKADRS